jgi:hypothetical protein
MKHVGKMKNNNAKVAVVYRTLPGEAHSALVVGTSGLQETFHDSLMSLIQSESGQGANELADVLAVRKFPDGSNMLSWLHTRGHLKKVPTNGVLMTPTTTSSIQLDELNRLIAEQKGVTIDELAVNDGSAPQKPTQPVHTPDPVVEAAVPTTDKVDTPAQMRSRADALFKEAQRLRKAADEIDPPKSKKKAVEIQAE